MEQTPQNPGAPVQDSTVQGSPLPGDTEPLSKVTDPEKVLHPEILRLYREKRGWIISADKNVLSANVVDDLIAGEKAKNTSRKILVSTLYTTKAKDLAFYVAETGEKQDIRKYLRYLGVSRWLWSICVGSG